MEEKKLTMKDYIIETPSAVLANIAASVSLTKSLVDEYAGKDYKRVIIVACGSSYNGSLCAQQFMHKILKKEVKVITPLTFIHYENDIDENDFVVVVSQSGRSTNSIEALQLIHDKGLKTIGITGDVESDFQDICDLVVDWGVGIEKVGMVTKGVVTLALYLDLFAVEAAKRTGILNNSDYEDWKKEMLKTVQAHAQLQESSFKYIESHKKQLLSMTNVWLISAGANLATAIEGSLKIGESVKIHATAYEAEEFLHGPVFPLNPHYTVIAFDSNDECSPRINTIIGACHQITDHTILITGHKTDDPDAICTEVTLKQELQPLAYLAVCPLLAEYASETLQTKMHPLYTALRQAVSTKSQKKPRQ